MRITEVRDRPGAFLEKLPALYRAAAKEEKTLSQFLEDEDPSHEWQNEDREIKAFGRVLQASGFRFRSDPKNGLWADTVEDIYEDDIGVALLPEWANTVYRRARTDGYLPQVPQRPMQRQILESTEATLGSTFRPYVDAAGLYQVELTPAIGLSDSDQ